MNISAAKWQRRYLETPGDPRKTALARASSTYKRQTHPLVREGDPRNQERNCQTYSVLRTETKIWSQAPDGCFIPRQTGRLTVGRNIRLRLSEGVQCVNSDSSFVIRHSGREGTRGPERNGASRRQLLIVSCFY
jgi:hypothetical protein